VDYQRLLERAMAAASATASRGQVADYIPALATVDPDAFGMAIATLGGEIYGRDQIRNLTRIQLIRILAAEGAADGLCNVVLFISTGPTRGQILRWCGSGFSSRAAMT
jgi:Glutaminase